MEKSLQRALDQNDIPLDVKIYRMYISSKILLSEEAKKELEDALDNKEPYVDAKTLGECIRDRYDNYRTNKVV